MKDEATALFSAFEGGVNSYTRHAASLIRKIVSAQALLPEQQQALEATLRSELESFTWFLLRRFDNVGCSLPDGILGYSILAHQGDSAKLDEYELQAHIDIREDEEDYADMWQDHLANRTPAA